MRKSRETFVLLLWSIAVFCKCGVAQTAPSPPPQSIPLTLKDAVRLALKQNPQVVALRLLSLESDRDRQISLSALLPQASLTSLGVVRQYNLASVVRTATRSTGGPFQFIQAGPAFSQSLFNLPLFRHYQISSEGVREAHAQCILCRFLFRRGPGRLNHWMRRFRLIAKRV